MYGGAWMWNPNNKIEEVTMEEEEEDDESWEVKAFEQDTKGNLSGTTWPPRSYTCNFCRREFRSAQALGGHMNVHRRDRASKAHHQGVPTALTAATTTPRFVNSPCVPPPSTFIIQSTEGLSHFYQFQNPNGMFGNYGEMMNFYGGTTTTTTTSFPTGNIAFSVLDSNSMEEEEIGGDESIGCSMKETTKGTLVDELDLELRLGHNPP